MLDDDALAALWQLSDRTGVRPEYVIPVLWLESGFDPARANDAGAPYYGINQSGVAELAAAGLTPDAFRAMTAGAQIRAVVTPRYASLVGRYGPIRSATRAYQGNFLPATLARARGLASIVSYAGDPYYGSNAGLDALRHRAITVADLATDMSHAAGALPVQASIARAYVLRPSERRRESVYGDDFLDPGITFTGVVLLALALARARFASP